ncbi:hypothetical protein ACFQ9X_30930 [Catenulispora yoronensis]
MTATVRALGADDKAVAEWWAACVRVQTLTTVDGAAAAVRRLPPDLATFTGRHAEVEALLRAVGQVGAPTVVLSAIEGMGGVGKTRLAVHVAHVLVRAGRFADVQLYVNLRGFDPDHDPAEPGTSWSRCCGSWASRRRRCRRIWRSGPHCSAIGCTDATRCSSWTTRRMPDRSDH